MQGAASELKSFSAGVESRSHEETPSLLHLADNFNIWPRIVFRQTGSWKHAAMLPSKQICICVAAQHWLFKKDSNLLNNFSHCSRWLTSIPYLQSAYFVAKSVEAPDTLNLSYQEAGGVTSWLDAFYI